MLSSQNISNQMYALLDAEPSGDINEPNYYGITEDIVPAINLSVKWVVGLVNFALNEKKITEEVFSQLSKTLVFRTSDLSRVAVHVFPDPIWSIRGVHPVISHVVSGQTPVDVSNNSLSYHRSDLKLSSITKSANRRTIEEWYNQASNPFAPGYNHRCEDLREYAYLNPEIYDNGSQQDGVLVSEIEIRPEIPNRNIGISYVPKPVEISELGVNDIPLWSQAEVLVVNKALNYISFKQGSANRGLYEFTSEDINVLAEIMTK